MTVSGPGLVPYVDPAFRVEAGMAPVEVVVEPRAALLARRWPAPGSSATVDNTGHVDFFDALRVALYSQDSSIVLPNNGDISLGDVIADSRSTCPTPEGVSAPRPGCPRHTDGPDSQRRTRGPGRRDRG